MQRQDEAANIVEQALITLRSPARDAVTVMRSLQYACELLGWTTEQTWFQRELVGYALGTEVPAYRKVPCRLVWHPRGGAYVNSRWMAAAVVTPDELSVPAGVVAESEIVDVRMGMQALTTHSGSALLEDTLETGVGHFRHPYEPIPLVRVRVVDSESLRSVLLQIENAVFDFTSKAAVNLKYGNMVSDIWTEYQASLESKLLHLPFGNHLAAINDGLRSANPEMWRSAVYACRSLLSDVARYLWRDPRPTYAGLSAGGKKTGELEVSGDKFANQLRAYLHVKGVAGTRGSFLRDSAAYLSDAIATLKDLQCGAHHPITLQDARSVAVFTYLYLGEVVRRTDMVPVEEYDRAPAQ